MKTEYPALGQSPCACWPGRLCDRSAKCSAEAMVRATPAPAPADHATVERWEAALTAVMPADLNCWHENSRREWPEVAVWVIEGLRQSRDEAWATVERLTATAPAPAAPTLPAHQRTAPARIYLHDGDDEHTEPFPAGMDDGVTWSSDNATGLGVPYVRADLIRSSVAEDRQETIIGHSVERGGWCVYSHYHGGDYTFEMGPFATRGGAEAAVRAPQAPQQAECPECIEQARLLGAGSEREAALTAEIEQLRRANEQYGQRERWWNDKMVDLEQQVASHSAGIARLQQICTSIHDGLLRGDDDRDLLDLAAQAWDGGPAPQQAELTDAIQQAVAAERERCLSIIEAHQVPVGNSAAGEMAAEWTMDALREVRDAIRSDPQVTSTGWDKP